MPAATTHTATTRDTVPAERRRPPATVLATVALTVLVTLFGGYGAIYFTGLEGFTDMGLTFLVAYEGIVLFGLVSAVALLRGSPLGRAGVISFALWLTAFNIFKVGYIREWEAISFGVVGLAIVGLALTSGVRRHVDRDAAF